MNIPFLVIKILNYPIPTNVYFIQQSQLSSLLFPQFFSFPFFFLFCLFLLFLLFSFYIFSLLFFHLFNPYFSFFLSLVFYRFQAHEQQVRLLEIRREAGSPTSGAAVPWPARRLGWCAGPAPRPRLACDRGRAVFGVSEAMRQDAVSV